MERPRWSRLEYAWTGGRVGVWARVKSKTALGIQVKMMSTELDGESGIPGSEDKGQTHSLESLLVGSVMGTAGP